MGALLKPTLLDITLGTPVFTPFSLFLRGEQGAWYDPSDLNTLFQDAAGTTPVTTSGDPVGRMLDKSGRGNHATQSTATARPLYQSAGGLHWLEFDGVDDFLITGSINFTANNNAATFCGLTKKGTGVGVFAELSATIASNAGSFFLQAPDATSSGNYRSGSRGAAANNANQQAVASGYTPPISNVISSTHSISGDLTTLRVNAIAATAAVGDKGAGTFGNYPMYLGSRGGTGVYFQGSFRGLIVRSSVTDAATISAIEQWIAAKSGVTL